MILIALKVWVRGPVKALVANCFEVRGPVHWLTWWIDRCWIECWIDFVDSPPTLYTVVMGANCVIFTGECACLLWYGNVGWCGDRMMEV